MGFFFFLQVPGVLVSMSAGLCSLESTECGGKSKTQASFIEHLGKFTFPVHVHVCLTKRERAVSLYTFGCG